MTRPGLFALLALTFATAHAAAPADTVYRNGTIVTVDPKDSVQQALAVRGGRIVYCLLYTSPSPRDLSTSRMPSSA